MRRRTGALHADDCEEYLTKLKTIDSFGPKRDVISPQITPYNVTPVVVEQIRNPVFFSESERSFIPEINFNPSMRTEQDDGCQDSQSNCDNNDDDLRFESVENRSPTILPAIMTEDDKPAQTDQPRVEKQFAVKTIIIGMKKIGKHRLVDSLVSHQFEEPVEAKEPSLDLVVKTCRDNEKTIKYHFWIKECNSDEIEKFSSIYKVYYSFVSSLLFVYSVNDKESFDIIKRSLEEVKKTVCGEQFKALLIGLKNKDSDRFREVNFDEGKELMSQGEFADFMEIDMAENPQKAQILGFLGNEAENYARKMKSRKQ